MPCVRPGSRITHLIVPVACMLTCLECCLMHARRMCRHSTLLRTPWLRISTSQVRPYARSTAFICSAVIALLHLPCAQGSMSATLTSNSMLIHTRYTCAQALRMHVHVPGAGQQRPGTKRRVLLTSRKPPTRRVMLNEDELVEYMQNR